MGGSPYQIAARLLRMQPPPSRNRSLEALRDPTFARGFALYRRLRALVAELAAADADGATLVVEARQRGGVTVMCLQWARVRGRRAAWLEPAAWQLLLEHSESARRLVAPPARASGRRRA